MSRLVLQSYRTNGDVSVRGFTLIELVLVILLVSILSVYAVSKNLDSPEMTLPSQAERLASDLRFAQSLAFTSGSRTLFTADTTTHYFVCKTSDGINCTGGHDIDIDLRYGAAVSVGTTVFNTRGDPTVAPVAPTYVLSLTSGSTAKAEVTVAPVTGFVSILVKPS